MTGRRQSNENDFTGSSDEWEARVFASAVLFRVHRFIKKDRQRFGTETASFDQAHRLARAVLQDTNNPSTVMIYAVGELGRAAMIPQAKWQECQEKWEAIHGKTNID